MWSDFYVVKHKSDLFFTRLYAAHFTCGQRGAEQIKPLRKAQKSPFHTRSEGCGSIPLFQVIVKTVPPFSRCISCDAIDKVIAGKWVPVSERLPELIPCSAGTAYSEAVITLTSERRVVEAIYDGNEFIGPYDFWECEDDEQVTHWAPLPMPLPEQPKEDDDGN